MLTLDAAIANGCFFNIGARLARYTKNDTYAQYAERTWDWLWGVGYIDNENWHVYDGAHVEHNCTDINRLKVSYNPAVLVQGAAFMYNYVSIDLHTRTLRPQRMLGQLADSGSTDRWRRKVAISRRQYAHGDVGSLLPQQYRL